MMEDITQFYLTKEEPVKACLLALREIILAQDANMCETIKYGMPCFCYQKKMCCYLWTDKKSGLPYILFVEGKHLNHPLLETGGRARMKVLTIDPAQDLPIELIERLLKEAIDLYRNGVIST